MLVPPKAVSSLRLSALSKWSPALFQDNKYSKLFSVSSQSVLRPEPFVPYLPSSAFAPPQRTLSFPSLVKPQHFLFHQTKQKVWKAKESSFQSHRTVWLSSSSFIFLDSYDLTVQSSLKEAQAQVYNHEGWQLAAKSTAECSRLWRLFIDNRHKLEVFCK